MDTQLRIVGLACFPAKTSGNELEIPAITIVLAGIVVRASGAKSQPEIGGSSCYLIRNCILAYVPAPLIVIPLDHEDDSPEG